MLIGNYHARVSPKGRTALPKKFRDDLGGDIIITQGYENSLVLVSAKSWSHFLAGSSDLPFVVAPARETDRFLMGNAFEVKPDAQGRFVVPPPLRRYAQIGDAVVFVGVGNRVEIWDASHWEEYRTYLDEHSQEIAEKLSQKTRKEG